MELSKFKKLKKLALVGLTAGLAAQPLVAAENQTVAEDNYYVRSCGGDKSCGGGYPKPYNQNNPAPVTMNEDSTTTGKTQPAAPVKNGAPTPAPAMKGDKAAPSGTTQTSRYYQKRDKEVADNTNFNPSNGLLPDQQKSGSNKPKTGTGSSGMSSSGSTSSSGSGSSSSTGSGSYGKY